MNRTSSTRSQNRYEAHKSNKKTDLSDTVIKVLLELLFWFIILGILWFVWKYVLAIAVLLFMFVFGGFDR